MKVLTKSSQFERDAFNTRVLQGLKCTCTACTCPTIVCKCARGTGCGCQWCWHPGNPVNQMEDFHWEEDWSRFMLYDGHPVKECRPIFSEAPCGGVPTSPDDCHTEEEKPVVEKKIDYSKITKGLCG